MYLEMEKREQKGPLQLVTALIAYTNRRAGLLSAADSLIRVLGSCGFVHVFRDFLRML